MRYILFSGSNYYASGGAYDIKFSHNDLNKVIDKFIKLRKKPGPFVHWGHIYDTKSRKIVWEISAHENTLVDRKLSVDK